MPHIVEDRNVAFPMKVFRLLGPNNVRKHAAWQKHGADKKKLLRIFLDKVMFELILAYCERWWFHFFLVYPETI